MRKVTLYTQSTCTRCRKACPVCLHPQAYYEPVGESY